MKEYTNGQRKGMMYGGMSRRKPMMYGGMAKKPRKKAQMGGSMTTTQKQQNQQMAGMMPMQPMNMQRMAEGGKLQMVEKDGKKVPFYAADGKGKMMYGGKAKKRG